MTMQPVKVFRIPNTAHLYAPKGLSNIWNDMKARKARRKVFRRKVAKSAGQAQFADGGKVTTEKSKLFSVPDLPPSLNEYVNISCWARRRLQVRWDAIVYEAWSELNKPVFVKPVRIEYTIRFKDPRRRDKDNYIGGTKVVTDALKRTFITRDDSDWLKNISVGFEIGEPMTMVLIEEVE